MPRILPFLFLLLFACTDDFGTNDCPAGDQHAFLLPESVTRAPVQSQIRAAARYVRQPTPAVGYLVPGRWDSSRELWRTDNGGTAWTSLPHPGRGSFVSAHFPDARRGYTVLLGDTGADVGRVTLYQTDDGGSSWTSQLIDTTGQYLHSIQSTPSGTLYALQQRSDRNVLLRSRTNGTDWTPLYDHTGLGEAAPGTDLLRYRDGALLVGGSDGALRVIDTTGVFLPALETGAPGPVRPLLLDDGTLLAIGSTDLRRYRPDADRWDVVLDYPVTILGQAGQRLWTRLTLDGCFNVDVGVSRSAIAFSDDGGATWQIGPPLSLSAAAHFYATGPARWLCYGGQANYSVTE